MTYKIAVLDDIKLLPKDQKSISDFAGQAVTFPVDTPANEEDLIARTGDARAVLMSPSVHITASYLDACPSVAYVGLCGTSTAHIDLEELSKRGIAFTNVTHYGDEATAELLFIHLAALVRGVGAMQWRETPRELMGKTMTIVGLGALGEAIAHLALGYNMQVNYYSRTRKPAWEQRGLHFGELAEVLPESDMVVTCVPTDTIVLGEKEFTLLKKGAIFVQGSAGTTFKKDSFLTWIAGEGTFAILGHHNKSDYGNIPRIIFPDAAAIYPEETKERLGHKVLKNLASFAAA